MMKTGIIQGTGMVQGRTLLSRVNERLKNISPFNNREDMSKGEFIVKKVLAYILTYTAAMFVFSHVLPQLLRVCCILDHRYTLL